MSLSHEPVSASLPLLTEPDSGVTLSGPESRPSSAPALARPRSESVVSRWARAATRWSLRRLLRRPALATALDNHLETVGWRGLAQEAVAWGCYRLGTERCWSVPENIRFEVSSLCNLRCVMCPQPHKMTRPKRLLDFDLYRQVLVANPHIKQVSLFNWGEPLLHPRITEFVALASARGIVTRLYSNAVLLNEEMTANLVAAGLRYMNFSVDNVGAAYQAIRGVPFERVWGHIAYFTRYAAAHAPRLQVGLAVTLSDDNRRESEELVRLARELGIHQITVADSETYDDRFVRRVSCLEPYRYLVVLSNGEVVPCCRDYDGCLSFGSVCDEPDLGKLYNTPAVRRLRRALRRPKTMPPLCAHCSYLAEGR